MLVDKDQCAAHAAMPASWIDSVYHVCCIDDHAMLGRSWFELGTDALEVACAWYELPPASRFDAVRHGIIKGCDRARAEYLYDALCVYNRSLIGQGLPVLAELPLGSR